MKVKHQSNIEKSTGTYIITGTVYLTNEVIKGHTVVIVRDIQMSVNLRQSRCLPLVESKEKGLRFGKSLHCMF